MALDATQVRVGVTGAVYVAPTGTTLPTDATTALAVAFDDVGYISEDGVTETQNTDTNDISAWQNGAVVRKIQTSHDLTYTFSMLETSQVSLEVFYGNYDAATDSVEIKGEELGKHVWVLSVEDGDHIQRVVIPDGQVTERGDITYANEDAVGREVTITAFPDTSGVKAYVYLAETPAGS
jgi:hypothetical protein